MITPHTAVPGFWRRAALAASLATGLALSLLAPSGALPAAPPAAPSSGAAPGLPATSVVTPGIAQDALAPITTDEAPAGNAPGSPLSAKPLPVARTAASVRQLLADGEACFTRKQYSCSIANATNALQIQPGNPAATRLKARAEAAQTDALNNIKLE